jgi:hypothetical protein
MVVRMRRVEGGSGKGAEWALTAPLIFQTKPPHPNHLTLLIVPQDEASSSSSSSSSSHNASATADEPPAVGRQEQLLRANIRSVREPRKPGHALVAPSWRDDPEGYVGGVANLKASLSGQAADFISQQVRECGCVVRRKLYLRRLAARDKGTAAAGGRAAAAVGAGAGSAALALGQPGQLEAWVDECLDKMVSGRGGWGWRALLERQQRSSGC